MRFKNLLAAAGMKLPLFVDHYSGYQSAKDAFRDTADINFDRAGERDAELRRNTAVATPETVAQDHSSYLVGRFFNQP